MQDHILDMKRRNAPRPICSCLYICLAGDLLDGVLRTEEEEEDDEADQMTDSGSGCCCPAVPVK